VTASLSRRVVAVLCLLLLVVGLVPLGALSLYNHAFYDDYGFSLRTSEAWQTEGTVAAVLKAAYENTFGSVDGSCAGTYNTWEGTYATSFLSTLQPAVFGEGAYAMTAFLLVGALLLALWRFLHQTLCRVYGMDRASVLAAFGLLGFLMTQFVPSAAEGFYWYNGGVAYTLSWAVFLYTAALWLKFDTAGGRVRCALLYIVLLAASVLLGGAKYSAVLPASLSAVCFTAWAFAKKRPKRWAFFTLTLVMLAGFALSAKAPGNAVRAQTLSGGMSAPKAVLEAAYFGLALIGHSFSLPLLAAVVLLVLLAVPAIRRGSFRFEHPVWVTFLCLGLFCAQLAPTLYTGNYLGDGRVLNTYYFTWVVLLAMLTLYWTGFCLRRFPCVAAGPALSGNRLKAVPLLLVAGMLLVGCVAYHPDGSASYGPQNMAGGSALRSLVGGKAAAYDDAMDARDALLNDAAQTDVALTPITVAPADFMGDALTGDNLDYVLSLYQEYYDKASVRLAQEEE
jgi:hypothetical protein